MPKPRSLTITEYKGPNNLNLGHATKRIFQYMINNHNSWARQFFEEFVKKGQHKKGSSLTQVITDLLTYRFNHEETTQSLLELLCQGTYWHCLDGIKNTSKSLHLDFMQRQHFDSSFDYYNDSVQFFFEIVAKYSSVSSLKSYCEHYPLELTQIKWEPLAGSFLTLFFEIENGSITVIDSEIFSEISLYEKIVYLSSKGLSAPLALRSNLERLQVIYSYSLPDLAKPKPSMHYLGALIKYISSSSEPHDLSKKLWECIQKKCSLEIIEKFIENQVVLEIPQPIDYNRENLTKMVRACIKAGPIAFEQFDRQMQALKPNYTEALEASFSPWTDNFDSFAGEFYFDASAFHHVFSVNGSAPLIKLDYMQKLWDRFPRYFSDPISVKYTEKIYTPNKPAKFNKITVPDQNRHLAHIAILQRKFPNLELGSSNVIVFETLQNNLIKGWLDYLCHYQATSPQEYQSSGLTRELTGLSQLLLGYHNNTINLPLCAFIINERRTSSRFANTFTNADLIKNLLDFFFKGMPYAYQNWKSKPQPIEELFQLIMREDSNSYNLLRVTLREHALIKLESRFHHSERPYINRTLMSIYQTLNTETHLEGMKPVGATDPIVRLLGDILIKPIPQACRAMLTETQKQLAHSRQSGVAKLFTEHDFEPKYHHTNPEVWLPILLPFIEQTHVGFLIEFAKALLRHYVTVVSLARNPVLAEFSQEPPFHFFVQALDRFVRLEHSFVRMFKILLKKRPDLSIHTANQKLPLIQYLVSTKPFTDFERSFLEDRELAPLWQEAQSQIRRQQLVRRATPMHQNAQSVHASGTHQTASEAALKLRDFYFPEHKSLDFREIMHNRDVINHFDRFHNFLKTQWKETVESLFSTEQKHIIRPYLNYLMREPSFISEKNELNTAYFDKPLHQALIFIRHTIRSDLYRNFKDPQTGFTPAYALILVLRAMEDLAIDAAPKAKARLHELYRFLIRTLAHIQTNYGVAASCPEGAFIMLLDTLHHEHPLVDISRMSGQSLEYFVRDDYEAICQGLSTQDLEAHILTAYHQLFADKPPSDQGTQTLMLAYRNRLHTGDLCLPKSFRDQLAEQFIEKRQTDIKAGFVTLQQVKDWACFDWPLMQFPSFKAHLAKPVLSLKTPSLNNGPPSSNPEPVPTLEPLEPAAKRPRL